ncbi:hypothetical protein CC86DRAFT_383652 [Ophiobolus disseminans]|uniref:DNA recombination and repair protein Rad51-like C-terminal domain-containing protein n=1 Tax=Ophiobolus disseminans TaxID=1469910 RepID=A0A6A6ZX22_9PLEO|nr:hypothetical protein CC86DRAFT_383652 [Ophiobolus disseminans]
MSANVGEGARKLGEKLLADLEVEDLSSILTALRELQVEKQQSNENTPHIFFGIPDLDILIPHPTTPILELVSPPAPHHPSGAGKTSLLYLIIAHAILPASLSSCIPLGGQNAATILFDPLHHFSIPRLAEVMLNFLVSKIRAAGKEIDETIKSEIKALVSSSLTHLHIFRPQSWNALLSTLRSLPDYLFDHTRHKSMHRRIHSMLLDDIDAFAWSIRHANTTATASNSLATASSLLTTSLHRLGTLLSCGVVLTSQSTTPTSFRPALPTSWPQEMAVTRLAVRRVEVLKFAPAISVEEAEVERAQRWDVVQKGRFECWKVGMGVKDGEGFVFRSGEEGVEVESNEGK